MTHAERMKEIKEREQAATAGPWVADINIYGKGKLVCCRNGFLPKGDKVAEVLELLAGLDSDSAMANALFIAHARADIPYLVARVEELEAALGEATNALMYIGDKAVVDWDGATVGEADAALAKLPETYKESYINFMRVAVKIWPLVIVGADMELNTITIACEAGGVKMGETLGALFYRRLTAIKEGRQ